MLYTFTISQNRKEVLSFNSSNAVQAYSLITLANRNAKYKKDFLSYSYKRIK
jgi:hypothetical protein